MLAALGTLYACGFAGSLVYWTTLYALYEDARREMDSYPFDARVAILLVSLAWPRALYLFVKGKG